MNGWDPPEAFLPLVLPPLLIAHTVLVRRVENVPANFATGLSTGSLLVVAALTLLFGAQSNANSRWHFSTKGEAHRYFCLLQLYPVLNEELASG